MADLDELLKILEEKLQEEGIEKPKPKKDSVDRFVEKCSIRHGLDRVPNYVIYYTYKKVYKKAEGEKRWSKVHFFRLFNKIFDQARVGKQRYYLLDGGSFDLTREGRIEAEAYDKEYKRKVGLKTGHIKPKKRRGRPRKQKG
jgi:hypothetical protein